MLKLRTLAVFHKALSGLGRPSMRPQNAHMAESAVPTFLANFKMRRAFPSLPSDVEDNHLPAKRLYERLKIILRIDVEIDV